MPALQSQNRGIQSEQRKKTSRTIPFMEHSESVPSDHDWNNNFIWHCSFRSRDQILSVFFLATAIKAPFSLQSTIRIIRMLLSHRK